MSVLNARLDIIHECPICKFHIVDEQYFMAVCDQICPKCKKVTVSEYITKKVNSDE
jgi:hypothetical protein